MNNVAKIISFCFFVYSLCTVSTKDNSNNELDIIDMTMNNTILIKDSITTQSADLIIRELYNMNSDKFYIYIDSPGGIVIDGLEIIGVINTLSLKGKNIICIANEAMSMAFSILQSCPKRYIKENSILMQHQMYSSFEGNYESLKNEMIFLEQMNNYIHQKEANRLKINFNDYENKIMNDWYIFGYDAIKENVADKMVYIKCDHELLNSTFNISYNTPFGNIVLEYSRCPLIKEPLSYNITEGEKNDDCDLDDYIKIKLKMLEWNEYCKNISSVFKHKYTCNYNIKNYIKNIFNITNKYRII